MKNQLTRREMIRISALLTGSMCLCPKVSGEEMKKSTCCVTPDIDKESCFFNEDSIIIDLAKAETLEVPGFAAQIVNKERKIQMIIVRTGETEYAALHRLCTHGGQVINYNRERDILQCNNSNHSIFDLNGQVIKGPAEKPLKKYETRLDSGKLIVMLGR